MAKRKNSASAGPNLPATATSDPRDKKTAQTVEETERVRKFLALAGERFKEAKDAESVYRKDCLDDLKFSIGGKNQWPATIRAQREDDGRPCLTMNRSGQFVNQVTNSQREQRPSVNVNPAGDGATVETAEILQGIIRHIELRSEAEVAYDTAFESVVRCGFGYWRIISEYADDDSMDMELAVEWVENQFSVYLDPNAQKPDRSDSKWGFVVTDMGVEEYKAEHGDDETASLNDFSSIGDSPLQSGLDKNRIRIAEYYRIEREKAVRVQVAGGETMLKAAWDKLMEDPLMQADPDMKIAASRTVSVPKVKWAKINALRILEERDVPGQFVPLVRVTGEDLIVDGERYVAGLIRDYKDPQRMYNFWVSAATETIALAPKTPIMAEVGQIEGYEAFYEKANTKNFAYLPYKARATDGGLVPPPQRMVSEPPIAAITQMIRQADTDMKATTGIYDAALGEHKSDESGRAILARQKQTDVGSLHFGDNLRRSMRFSGRLLLSQIPEVYDSIRIQRIVKPDGSADHVGVFNSKLSGTSLADLYSKPITGLNAQQAAKMEELKALKKIFDIGVGRYDVTVSVGPSQQSRRQEAVESMMTLVKNYPQMMNAVGDLLVSNMDWPGAKEIAARLKKLVPPNLLDDGDQSPDAIAARYRSQFDQLSQQHQAIVAELAKATELIKTKKLDLESRERIAGIQAQAGMIEAAFKAHTDGAMQLMQEQFAVIRSRLDLLHEGMSIDNEILANGGTPGAAPVPPPQAAPTPQPGAQG